MSIVNIARLKKSRELESKIYRAKNDLRYLAIDICGYTWMAGPWHRQIFKFIDDNRHEERVALFSPRKSYKSRIECVEMIREILINPNVSIALIHHKLELARELVVEVGELLQKNKVLRELLPNNNTPGGRTPSFIKRTKGGEFSLPGTSRAKYTLKGFSAEQDETGGHPDIIFMDDIISAKTIEFHEGLEGVAKWIEHTVIPMAGAGVSLRVKGTMWSPDDWYHDIMNPLNEDGSEKVKPWSWICRAILEDEDGKPDEKAGKPIEMFVGDKNAPDGIRLLSMKDIQGFREEMKSHFAGQMMNDPAGKGSRPWIKERCEHHISSSAVKRFIKKIVVLVDPAPLGMDHKGRLVRPDGEKDYWANAVIGYMKLGRRTVRVLLDGSMSQVWTMDEGMAEIKRLMRKWSVKIVGIEELRGTTEQFYGRALKEKFGEAERAMGRRCKPIKFKGTQKGKPPRIMDLCAMAGMRDEDGDSDPLFLICKDTCNVEFLKMFLNQAENWAGDKTIKHDDCLDAVAYADDPALMELIKLGGGSMDLWHEETYSAPPEQLRLTRHCPI